MSIGGRGTVGAGDALRGRLHGMWESVAGGWERHAAYADARGGPVAEVMLDRAAPGPGERVLELACGPGGAGIAAARRVGPGGEVVLSDVAGALVAVALARAAEAGVVNVTGRRRDIEDVEEPDASFDVVLCRDGLMFAVDPARGAREMARVLRPGGRIAVAVWGPPARNPWLGVVMDTAAEHLGRPMPPPGVPGPFSLGDAGAVAALLRGAALADVVVEEVDCPLLAASPAEWWERTTALAGPLAGVLAGLPPASAAALEARAWNAAAEWAEGDGLAFPGVALVASARRA